MSAITDRPTYGTVEYYTAKLAEELTAHDRHIVLLGRLRACIDFDDLDTARNLLAAYDQLADVDIWGRPPERPDVEMGETR